jgi:hypothetical protein
MYLQIIQRLAQLFARGRRLVYVARPFQPNSILRRSFMKATQYLKMALIVISVGFMSLATAKDKDTDKDKDFAKDHPRRAEVNERIRSERRRIKEGMKSGKISPEEGKRLLGELDGVKAEEKAEVKANGGYLTKTEQKQLNQELNQDSKQIYKDKHPAQGAAPVAAAPAPATPAPTTPSSN